MKFKMMFAPIVWFIRIPLRAVMLGFLHLGAWIAALHGVTLLLEYWLKDYAIIIDKNSMCGLIQHKKNGKAYHVRLSEGKLREVTVKTTVAGGGSDG